MKMKTFSFSLIGKIEFAVPVLAAIMAVPATIPQSQAIGVMGGDGGDCVRLARVNEDCSSLANNTSACVGTWTKVYMDKKGLKKELIAGKKWCVFVPNPPATSAYDLVPVGNPPVVVPPATNPCDSSVSAFNLLDGCGPANATPEYEVAL